MEEPTKKLKKKTAKYIAPEVDKRNIRVSMLNPVRIYIGKWKFECTKEEDQLVVKGYFVRKQLCYEVLRNGCREKIEIEWSNIIGIRAALKQHEPGILELELLQPPKFYKQLDNIKEGAHRQWVDGLDFTNGQASISRRHLVMFPPRMLDEHFERLIRLDENLYKLTQRRYPTFNVPYFHKQTLFQTVLQNHFGVPSFRASTQQIQRPNHTLQFVHASPNPISPSSGSGSNGYSWNNGGATSNGCSSCSNSSSMCSNGSSNDPHEDESSYSQKSSN